jgi:hypothetical protein
MAGLGAGLTGAVGAQYQFGVDRTREAVANLTGGLGEVTATPGTDIANAAQYTGATMPANTLEANAAAAARMAQSDAAARAQNIHQIGLGYGAKADDAISQAASDARALIAKRPETIAELVNTLNQTRQTGIANVANVLSARTSYRQTEQKRLDDLKQQRFANHQAAVASKLARDTFNRTTRNGGRGDRADRRWTSPRTHLTTRSGEQVRAFSGSTPRRAPTLSSNRNRRWQAQLARSLRTERPERLPDDLAEGEAVPQTDARGATPARRLHAHARRAGREEDLRAQLCDCDYRRRVGRAHGERAIELDQEHSEGDHERAPIEQRGEALQARRRQR